MYIEYYIKEKKFKLLHSQQKQPIVPKHKHLQSTINKIYLDTDSDSKRNE